MEFEKIFEKNFFEEDENENDKEREQSGSIFLIDCKQSLFERSNQTVGTSNTWFEAIIEGCLSTAKNKALNSGKDSLALVFFRVNKTTDVFMQNVFVFQNLEVTSIENIQKLIQLKSISENDFEDQYGFCEQVSLFQALWCCQHLFGKMKQKFGSKQILLFTDDDNPHQGDEYLKRRIFVKGRDLTLTGTHMELIPITNVQGFDIDKFYKTLLLTNLSDDNDETVTINDPVAVIQELTTRIRHKQLKKRKLAQLMWQLGSDQLVISVGVYSLVRKTPPPSWVKLHRNTNAEVISKTAMYLKRNDQMLMPFDMKYCLTIGNKSISFEPEEVNKIRSIIDPGIRLLGFKSMKYLKSYYQIRAAQFIYPDESVIEGSINLFSSLLIRCSERNLFALCVYVPRKSAQIRFAALVPQMEKLDKSRVQTRPPGFHVIFLPFANDIRHLDLPASSEIKENDKEMCKKLVETLSIEYDPEVILNPALQKKLMYIEAMALDYEKVEEIEDHTMLDCEEINNHCGAFLNQFKNHFRLSEHISIEKKLNQEETVDIKSLCSEGKLNNLTVLVLKKEAMNLGIKLSVTTKKGIIEVIKAHFNKE